MKDPRAAWYLLTRQGIEYLRPFLAQENTIANAAKERNLDPVTLAYRVKRMQELGLLTIVRTRQRSGRALKVYRSTADEFLVPQASLPAGADAVVQENFVQRYNAVLAESVEEAITNYLDAPREGYRVSGGGGGTVAISGIRPLPAIALHEDPSAPAVVNEFLSLDLDFAAAKELQRELHTLLKRFEERDKSGKQRYIIHAGLAPTRHKL